MRSIEEKTRYRIDDCLISAISDGRTGSFGGCGTGKEMKEGGKADDRRKDQEGSKYIAQNSLEKSISM